jgi:hypothetical protein
MPTIDPSDDGYTAVDVMIQRAIEEDRFPAPQPAGLGSGETRSNNSSGGQEAAGGQKHHASQAPQPTTPKGPPTSLKETIFHPQGKPFPNARPPCSS